MPECRQAGVQQAGKQGCRKRKKRASGSGAKLCSQRRPCNSRQHFGRSPVSRCSSLPHPTIHTRSSAFFLFKSSRAGAVAFFHFSPLLSRQYDSFCLAAACPLPTLSLRLPFLHLSSLDLLLFPPLHLAASSALRFPLFSFPLPPFLSPLSVSLSGVSRCIAFVFRCFPKSNFVRYCPSCRDPRLA